MEKELPVRKKLRLEGYDYSNAGYYFCTICVENGHELLGRIVVGYAVPCVPLPCVPIIELSDIGKIVKTYLENMNTVIEYAFLEKHVIMPNHVHLLIALNAVTQDGTNCVTEHGMQDGVHDGTQRTASPTKPPTKSPTKAVIPRIVHGMKSVTTKQIGYPIWQRSYHEHIVRNHDEYNRIWQYIDKNPTKWIEDRYYQTQL